LGDKGKAAGTGTEWRRAQLATGRILQFDHARGYGFVAADDGGEDVFLHASVFDEDPDGLAPGIKVEFKVMAGDRGRKAFAAHLIDDEPEIGPAPVPRPVPPARPVPVPHPAPPSLPLSPSGPAPSPPPAQASTGPAPVAQADAAPPPHAPGDDHVPDDEQMCDVLSPVEFGQELTELLLSNVPSLTGRQVLEVRQSLLESAKKHGWVDL
jgi:cold shock CspA family protein